MMRFNRLKMKKLIEKSRFLMAFHHFGPRKVVTKKLNTQALVVVGVSTNTPLQSTVRSVKLLGFTTYLGWAVLVFVWRRRFLWGNRAVRVSTACQLANFAWEYTPPSIPSDPRV